MNYIHRLQAEVAELKADKAVADKVLTSLVGYLTSSKFYDDPTVQVADVLRRIEDARTAVMS